MPIANIKKIIIIAGVVVLLIVLVAVVSQILKKQPLSSLTPVPGETVGGPGGLPAAGPGGTVTSTQVVGQLPEGVGQAPSTGEPGGTAGQEAAPVSRDNKIQDLVEYTSADPTLAKDGAGIQYYDRADNKFYTINETGEVVAMSSQQFFNADKVTWSPDKDRAIIAYPDGSKIIYDFAAQKQVTLPKHWEEFNFSPNGSQVAFKSLGYDQANSWLAVMNSDGTMAKTVTKIGANADNILVSWSPNNQMIGMEVAGDSFDQKKIYFIGLNGENFKSLTTQGRGFMPLWSPAGNQLLYSVYSSDNNFLPSLWVTDSQGGELGANLRPLGLNTWANKCIFNGETEAYCAVPRNLDQGAGMIPASAKNATDDLYLVNIGSGQKILIDGSGQYNMTNLILTQDKKFIYFTDSISGKLYKLAI
jgi:Tol biopolymer transport system component